MFHLWNRRAIIGLAVLSLSLTTVGLNAQEDPDDAGARAKAKEEWYLDNYGRATGARGGSWSAAYRRFVLSVAARERARYPNLLPGLGVPSTLVPTWTNLGPNKSDFIKNGSITLNEVDAGRARDIIVDPTNPQRIFFASSSGGVWRTTDGGATWTAITESLGSLCVGALAMDPANPNVLYLGLGDPFDGTGIGLVKSTDGGNTWSAPVFLGNSTIIPDIMVSPSNSNVVVAATNTGLYRSTDAGATFSLVSIATGQAELPYVWSVASTGGQGMLIALEALRSATSGTTQGQTWWSADNGATWTRSTGFAASTGVGRGTVATAPSNRQVAYSIAAVPNATSRSDFAEFFRSTDGGRTWTAARIARKTYTNSNAESRRVNQLLGGQGFYNHMLMVSPADSNTVYVGGQLLMARTDAGNTFTQLTNWLAQFSLPYVHADFHAGTFGPDGAMYVGTDGGIFKSTNNGTTWSSSLNIGLITHLPYSVGSSPASVNAVTGGLQDNGTRVRSGATSTFNQTLGGDGFAVDISQTNANNMLGTLYFTDIRKSTNAGSTFSSSCSGITECGNSASAPFFTKIARWEGDPNTLFTAVNTKVYKSTNYATSWTALGVTGLPTTSLFIRNVNAAKTNANVVGVVANSGRVFTTVDGGATWTQSANPPNNGLSMSYIHFDTTNPSIVYVASVAPDATKNHLWKSTDGGANWTAIDGGGFPFGIPVNIIKNDPTNASILYAGTHLGIYRSTDGGSTWTRYGSGLPLVEVSDIYISADSTLFRAAAYGRGFWQLNP